MFRISHLPLLVCVSLTCAHAGLIVNQNVAGANPAGIQAAVDAFRAQIGGGTVAGANGLFGGIRREINWDGVPDSFSDPNNLPANFFNVNSPRGVVFSTAGTGFLTSADSSNPTSTPTLFTGLNAGYAGAFQTFSAERLFGVVGSTDLDVNFFQPGTSNGAFVTSFGAVFVDNTQGTGAGCASIAAFNGANSLGINCAVATNAGGLSFLAVSATGSDVITRIRIHLGNGVLGSTQSPTNEVVVMDDFIFSNPTAPEPSTAVLTLGALLLVAISLRMKSAVSR